MLDGFDCLVLFYKSYSLPYSCMWMGQVKNTERLAGDLGSRMIVYFNLKL